MLDIETTDTLPTVRRGGGRPSAERQQIQNALSTLETQVVRNVECGNNYNALQQRIRQAAAALGLKVRIVQRRHEDNLEICDLYFVGLNEEDSSEKKTKTVRKAITDKTDA